MQIEVAEQRMLLLKDKLTPEEAKDKAWQKKVGAFDALSKVVGLLSRPKDEDFELTYSEHRYEPFWHVKAQARYAYRRKAEYRVPVSAAVVKGVTVLGQEFDSAGGAIRLPVTESCLQEELDENYVDGVSGKSTPGLKAYLEYGAAEVAGELKDAVAADAILVPPQARVSAIMRDSLSKMIKGIQADEILEEKVEVANMDLYYRPVYAFKYLWKAKQKEAILEIDGLTGEARTGSRVFNEYVGKMLERDFLFDVTADAVGMFVPGGSIAVKAVKKVMDARKA